MTTNQLFFATLATFVTVNGLLFGILIKYLDAKIENVNLNLKPMKEQLDLLVNYMILHEGKIATLEERTKGKN